MSPPETDDRFYAIERHGIENNHDVGRVIVDNPRPPMGMTP